MGAGDVSPGFAFTGLQECHKVPDPDLFYQLDRDSIEAAKAVCARCPLIAQCRDWALATEEPHGVWGGLDEGERKKLRAGAGLGSGRRGRRQAKAAVA